MKALSGTWIDWASRSNERQSDENNKGQIWDNQHWDIQWKIDNITIGGVLKHGDDERTGKMSKLKRDLKKEDAVATLNTRHNYLPEPNKRFV